MNDRLLKNGYFMRSFLLLPFTCFRTSSPRTNSPFSLRSPVCECPCLPLGRFSSRVLTSRSLCRLQEVSAPGSVGLFPCPDKSLPLPSPGSECVSVDRFLSVVLTSTSICRLQNVSAPRSVDFFPYPDKSLPLPSAGSEWASVSRFFFVS